MRLLVAPDSFKGSLTSVEVARALAEGWSRGRPDDTVRLSPLADGGEGTLDAVAAAGGWSRLPAAARDPRGEPLDGRFLRQDDRAVVEMATASGLSRVPAERRDAMAASTFGTGLILAAAIGLGARRIVLGLGGSATTDGGSGLLRALGVRFLDASGGELPMGGGALDRLARVDLSGLAPILSEVALVIASDVTNPLLGELGAAETYGPQKGADPSQVARLDANLAHYAEVLEAEVGRSLRDVPGAGAAGGTTAGLLAIADRFASFEVRPGVEVVMELTGFDEALVDADLVLTGEGRVDRQTAFGKTALGVARRAADAGRPCICFGGGVTEEGIAALASLGVVVVPVTEAPISVEAQMAAGVGPLERAAERASRLVTIGRG
ncbi:MAG: glycerate kinase [Chloroflexi bacterium]|nr:glycerate kinase [Chloroflexota bacterium]MBA3850871.1 glycerate kinase [Chloroflexota bacterium]